MTNDFASFSEKQLNDKTAAFITEFKPVIEKAAANVGLDPFFFDEVVSSLAVKFSLGKINYDPSKGVERCAYIYAIAHNMAVNYLRKNEKWLGFTPIIDDENFDAVEHGAYTEPWNESATEDARMVFTEALKRLSKEHDPLSVEIFLRAFLRNESYVDLARQYRKNPSTVASMNSRLLGKFKKILAAIFSEEEKGCFVKSTNSIDYLNPYLGFLNERIAA